MADYVQISAQISKATRDRLDQYARETGMKKSRLVEDAVRAHLDTLDEVPAEYVVSNSLIVDDETWSRILRDMDEPDEPTSALRDLVKPRPDED